MNEETANQAESTTKLLDVITGGISSDKTIESGIDILFISGVVIAALLVVSLVILKLYKKASKETSFVRTGFGGQKVILNGGSLVFPVLHETIPVNMNTLHLTVSRANEEAIITRDRMRVDTVVEFYVRVQPSEEAIATAAQSLGQVTMRPQELKSKVEAKFVDALRAVAAKMTMEELHEQRAEFVQQVQEAVSEDLIKNGLELESVSLTNLDQTAKEHFNEDNIFDAEGLTLITQRTENHRKKRNDIERTTSVEIQRQNLDAEKQSIELKREEEFAKITQTREIQIKMAFQETEIAQEKAKQAQASQEAEIASREMVEKAQIETEKRLQEERIKKQRVIEIAEQERKIVISQKSEEESKARGLADLARADAIKAEQQVITEKEVAEAERDKLVEVIQARKDAEKQSVSITVAAEAEKAAAEDNAQAILIETEAKAQAEINMAKAKEFAMKAEAEGLKLLNEAENVLNENIISLRRQLETIKILPQVIEASVKPIEKIDGIKLVHFNGPGGSSLSDGGSDSGKGQSLPNQMVSAALQHRMQAPLVDELLKDVGLSIDSNSGVPTLENILLQKNDAVKANDNTPKDPAH